MRALIILNAICNLTKLRHKIGCIYHGRNSNLVEFEILPIKNPIGVSTSRNGNTSHCLIQTFPTQFLGNSISPTDIVKNLGVTFDTGNTFTSHINKVCHACYYHFKDLRIPVWRL